MRSLRARLTISLVTVLVIVLAAQWLVVSLTIRGVTEDYIASRLEHDAQALLAGLSLTQEGPRLDETRIAAVFQRPFSGHYYQIRYGTQVLRSRSLWDQQLSVPDGSGSGSSRARIEGPQGQQLLAITARYRKGGEPITLTVAEDVSALQTDIAAFRWRYSVVSILVLVALVAVQSMVVTLGMRPLESLRRELGRLLHGDATRLETDVPQEVRPVVEELNRLLSTAGERLHRYRSAVGNLAHALKTPLARLRQLLDGKELESQPEVRARLDHEINAIQTLTERELRRARLSGGAMPGQHADLVEIVTSLKSALEQIYRDKGVTVAPDLPETAQLAADHEDMTELLGNLLDNACKWAHRQVRVTARVADSVIILVEDDGPGADPQRLEAMTRRGARMDESVSGHGLGLSIAADVVHQYGGGLAFGRSDALGGLEVEVTLPMGG